jgi:hypothetical protein
VWADLLLKGARKCFILIELMDFTHHSTIHILDMVAVDMDMGQLA